jgi:hypothetical protein
MVKHLLKRDNKKQNDNLDSDGNTSIAYYYTAIISIQSKTPI